jgi:3',5'-cyclic AMP phosphodiesterase CpdA
MRRIAHISDLHFGHEDAVVAEGLLRDLADFAPAVVAISGDLTQRARPVEFQAARDYIARLPAPAVVVPGNHDVPLWNVYARFTKALHHYREYITRDMAPLFRDDALAVLGINTARSLTFKGGRISHQQIADLRTHLEPLPKTLFKVVVTHHQFLPHPGGSAADLLGRGAEALHAIEACGVDLLLAGHVHLGWTGDVRSHYPLVQRSILVAQAGTAISTRGRGEPNSYNRITVQPDHVEVELRNWDGGAFLTALVTRYRRVAHEWVRQ